MKSCLLTFGLTLALLPHLHTQAAEMRVWTNQQGLTVKAALVEVRGVNVVIELENGSKSTVHLATLSRADQDYVEQSQNAETKTSFGAASGSITWPSGVMSLEPKTIEVKEGLQDEAGRQYHYECGNFEFISSAPLAKSVMSEVAADFLLTEQIARNMPWGWEPRPKEGAKFQVLLAETKDDYVKLFGGNDTTISTVVNGKSLIIFSAIGLKKVGPRYQFDSRLKDPGGVTSITAYGMFYDIRGMMSPWTRYAYPSILQRFAYQDNGTVRFTDLSSALKKYVKLYTEDYKVELDLERMLKTMRAGNGEVRTEIREINQQLNFDASLLGYYFGFLDGDGSGSRLHHYYRQVLIRAGKVNGSTAPGMENASPADLMNILFEGRTDIQIKAEMIEKFSKVGVRFKK